MNYRSAIFLIIASFFQLLCFGQAETYSVKKAFFSSDMYDEFSPVYYNDGIVFCSDRNMSLMSRSNDNDKGIFKIFYIDTTLYSSWQNARLFSKDLTTFLNDGPVTFNKWHDTIYYSRNIEITRKLKDISGPRNRLGIFYAVNVDGQWTKVRDLRLNSEWYSITTPWLSPDGKKLYFASDKPGGYGGSDLYYSEWKDDYWNDPVNLGPVINTEGNESYPFINPAGELFFASDGHAGLGGKDIFFSRYSDSAWLAPVHIDPPINSAYDDFGIITDSLMNKGYFSSNRDKSIDIYKFKTNFPQIFYTTMQKENQYCFSFCDTGKIEIDTTKLSYVWDFGDGNKVNGDKVNYCFPGPGRYFVRLDLIDKVTGKLFFNKLRYEVVLKDYIQPYINSYEFVVKGDSIDFDAYKSYLPGYRILSYSWDFGDGTREQGPKVKHLFEKKGEYMVNIGLVLKDDSTGTIRKIGASKKIIVLNDITDISSYLAKRSSENVTYPDIRKYRNAHIRYIYSAEKDFKQGAVFEVELTSSKSRMNINSSVFKNVPDNYEVDESYNNDDETYSYIVDREMKLMDAYIAFSEMQKAGLNESHIVSKPITDPAEKEIFNLLNIFGTSTDIYFDSYNRLTSSAYLFLDQVIKIINKYPGIRVGVDFYTDNSGSSDEKLKLTKRYAQIFIDYLVSRGIDSGRLVGRGYGDTKPIASNESEEGRKHNRRMNFVILH